MPQCYHFVCSWQMGGTKLSEYMKELDSKYERSSQHWATHLSRPPTLSSGKLCNFRDLFRVQSHRLKNSDRLSPSKAKMLESMESRIFECCWTCRGNLGRSSCLRSQCLKSFEVLRVRMQIFQVSIISYLHLYFLQCHLVGYKLLPRISIVAAFPTLVIRK